jgi:serine/threonine protein kinase
MLNTTIAHYKTTAKLGQGGMGEVYRATDTKLGREVAIKVLPEALAGDAERLAPFGSGHSLLGRVCAAYNILGIRLNRGKRGRGSGNCWNC